MDMRLGETERYAVTDGLELWENKQGETGELISLWEKCNQFPSIYQRYRDKIDSRLYAAGNNVEFLSAVTTYIVSHCAHITQRDIILKRE